MVSETGSGLSAVLKIRDSSVLNRNLKELNKIEVIFFR